MTAAAPIAACEQSIAIRPVARRRSPRAVPKSVQPAQTCCPHCKRVSDKHWTLLTAGVNLVLLASTQSMLVNRDIVMSLLDYLSPSRPLLIQLGMCLALNGLSEPTWADSNVTSTVVGLNSYTAAVLAPGPPATIVFVATALPAGTEGCPAHTPMNIVYLDMSDTQGATLYAALLSGYLSGQSMQIGIRGCSSSGVPKVYSVLVGSQS